MSDFAVLDSKKDIRSDAFARRKAAQSPASEHTANLGLTSHLRRTLRSGQIVSGYMAIRTEIDPMSTMTALAADGVTMVLPVIQGAGRPLLFREWTPDSAMIEGDFGALIPRGGRLLDPDVLITPLVAFSPDGVRLGFGGGFYDRTLANLRAIGKGHAVGFAFEGQKFDRLPQEPTDQRLDALVTEAQTRVFNASS